MKKTLYILFVIIFISKSARSQNDTTIFTFEDFIGIVKSDHPLAKQADLQLKEGEAALLRSKGAFDPEVFTDISEKNFKNKEYYNLINGGLRIPTWFGINLTGGYEQNQGVFLNSENTTPNQGLVYAGISLPIGQGLFIDKRRAELQRAKLFKESTEIERQLMLNDLLFEAGKGYWDWFSAYHIMSVYENALKLAEERFNAVKQSAEFGDRPFIDTLEAGIQVQNRLLNLQQSRLDFANATALISIYLWVEGSIPLELTNSSVPVSLDGVPAIPMEERYYILMDTLLNNHPRIQQFSYSIDQLKIDRRLRREQLKPVLNLKYNPITEPASVNPIEGFNRNNYTWGIEFNLPIFLREARGELQMANVRIKEAELELNSLEMNTSYRAKVSLNDWRTSKEQIDLYIGTVEDYNSLLEGERKLFYAGESSLFMVNAREVDYINAQVKLIQLLSKNRKARLASSYTFGELFQVE